MLKAVWLTNTDSQILHARKNIAEGLQILAELGFDTIYPTVWSRGHTLYPSEIAKRLTGAPVLPDSPFVGRDVLTETIELAKPLQLRVIPWFEYGLMVPPQSTIAHNHRDLLTVDRHQRLQPIQGANARLDPHAWLNPCHDLVQKFIVELIADVANRYPIAGIQLDDHFCFPQAMGYDRVTQQLFQEQHLGKSAPVEHDCRRWIDWGAARVTHLLTQIVSAIQSIRRECIVSIAPNPLNFSRTRYLADWKQWQELGLIDELVLQVYRDRLSAFKLELTQPEVSAIRQKIPTSIGILTGLKNRPIADDTIERQVATINAAQFAGVACFFYETLFHEQISPTLVRRDLARLKHIFGTH